MNVSPCCWCRTDTKKAQLLADKAAAYKRLPNGGMPLRLVRVKAGASRAQWTLSDGMQSFCWWPTKRRAMWTLQHAGWWAIPDGFYVPRKGDA